MSRNIDKIFDTSLVIISDYGIIKQLDFSHTLYYGTIENGNLTTDTIILVEGYTTDMNATLTGGVFQWKIESLWVLILLIDIYIRIL